MSRAVRSRRDSDGATMMRTTRCDDRGRSRAVAVLLSLAACGGKKPPVARRCRRLPRRRRGDDGSPRPPAPPEPVAEPTDRAARAGARRRDRVGVARRPEPELAAEAGVLRATTAASSRRRPDGARRERRGAEAATPPGRSRSKDTATSAAPPSTIWHWASGARVAARAYLVSLGIPADRLRTVSYGKEFPFDPGHDEAALSKNRRAHFVITRSETRHGQHATTSSISAPRRWRSSALAAAPVGGRRQGDSSR